MLPYLPPNKHASTGQEIVVYSCYFGENYEPFNRHSMGDGQGYDRVLFTDNDIETPEGVHIVQAPNPYYKSSHWSRFPKLVPHQFLEGYKWAIYVDNNASLKAAPQAMISDYEAELQAADDSKIFRLSFPHLEWDNLFQELQVTRDKRMISNAEYHQIMGDLERLGYPNQSFQLGVNTCIIRRLDDPRSQAFDEQWLNCFLYSCKRDQISLPITYFMFGFERVPLFSRPMSDYVEWPKYLRKDREGRRKLLGKKKHLFGFLRQ